jgi:hypothetical protein
MISKVNSVSSMAFKGVWGNIQYKDNKPVANYYPFIDETQEEISKEIAAKTDSFEASKGTYTKMQAEGEKLTAIVNKPIQMTRADFNKFNRGFITEAIAKMLIK